MRLLSSTRRATRNLCITSYKNAPTVSESSPVASRPPELLSLLRKGLLGGLDLSQPCQNLARYAAAIRSPSCGPKKLMYAPSSPSGSTRLIAPPSTNPEPGVRAVQAPGSCPTESSMLQAVSTSPGHRTGPVYEIAFTPGDTALPAGPFCSSPVGKGAPVPQRRDLQLDGAPTTR
jgi:hypothetical protein